MLDIKFYQKIAELKKKIELGLIDDSDYVANEMELARSQDAIVFNIETTNVCNMKCKMCPRTTLMTRSIKTMDTQVFRNVVKQINPHSQSEWQEWEDFVVENYGISPSAESENHFFLYVIPKVVVLHGFGEPVLDKEISQKVGLLTDRKIPSYFSCNPANINIKKMEDIFKSGLSYIKFSLESTNDP